jgi:hypothetical protein
MPKINFYHVGFFVGSIILFIILRNLGYIFQEFAFHTNVNVKTCSTCSMKHRNKLLNTKRIPNIIHQIYFPLKSKTPSKELTAARETWIGAHKNYTFYLWNETSILHLIREQYAHLEPIYHSYDYWVRRLNIIKYLSTYHYGGWYVDMDVTCKHRYIFLVTFNIILKLLKDLLIAYFLFLITRCLDKIVSHSKYTKMDSSWYNDIWLLLFLTSFIMYKILYVVIKVVTTFR